MAFEKTKAELETDELYVHCPMCENRKLVIATINEHSDYISCPLCGATGEADREKAEQYISQHEKMEE